MTSTSRFFTPQEYPLLHFLSGANTGSSFSLPDHVAKNYPQPRITVYEFVARPDYNKPRYIWCREGRVIAAGPQIEDVVWALGLSVESNVQHERGRTLVRPFDIKQDVIDKRLL
jgi:hypothetical protein